MDPEDDEALRVLLLGLVPADGTSIGNQALRDRFLEASRAAGRHVTDPTFERLRAALIEASVLVKCKGRGGSLRRAQTGAAANAGPAFTLEHPSAPRRNSNRRRDRTNTPRQQPAGARALATRPRS